MNTILLQRLRRGIYIPIFDQFDADLQVPSVASVAIFNHVMTLRHLFKTFDRTSRQVGKALSQGLESCFTRAMRDHRVY